MFRSPLADGLVVVVILLLFFGPKRLPMLSRSIGASIKEFKGGISDGSTDSQELKAAPSEEPKATPSTTAEGTESTTDSKTSA